MKDVVDSQNGARFRFFEQFNLPEAKIIEHIGWLEASYREFIERAYHASRSQIDIRYNLECQISDIRTMSEEAIRFGDEDRNKTYTEWISDLTIVLDKVKDEHFVSSLLAEMFGGGPRKPDHFLHHSLPRDCAIMAIENWLDLISGLRMTEKKRRNYQAAGLLYYMGYEDWMLPPDSPFPHYLRSDSDICRRYRSLRDHARNYLGATAREAQGEAFRNRLAERQDELINAAIRKGLKLDK